jgi:glucose-6-phosphate dehydrogenase assembly protein OpcA
MVKNQASVLLDDPREVDVSKIEQELTLLWKEASEGGEGASAPVVRACSLNLLFVTDTTEMLEEAGELIGEVTVEHPGRIFLIVADRRKGTPSLETWISARCSLPAPGGKQVCCEQINIIAAGTEANRIPSMVTALLVPDVPTVLLWNTKVQREDGLLRALIRITDRVLIDSSADESPQEMFHAWKEYLREEERHTTFGDLGWTHLTPWRTALAQVVQPLEVRKLLTDLDSVTIEYSATPEPAHSGLSQAFLFSAWLAQRLRWTLIHPLRVSGAGAFSSKLRLGEQAITVNIAPVGAREGKPGAIEAVRIHGADGTAVTIRAFDDTCFTFTRRIGGEEREERIPTSRHTSESQIIAEELEVLQRDEHYEAALATLHSLLPE